MAFNKRTWKGRQGTGLNKFSIDGATPVTVINQPDSVTEQGDALSAGNLNDLEDRIYTAFEDEATARANADSNLKDAIDNNSQRIENLEVAVSGSLVQTNTDATMANTKTITNANEILPWAILKRVGARSVAWNQLFNIIEVVTTSTQQLYAWADIIPNHVYLVVTQPNIASWQTWETETRSNNWSVPGAGNNMGSIGPNDIAIIVTPTTYKYFCLRNAYNTISVSGNVDWKPMLFDLTAMNEYDSTLTDAQNIAKFRAKFPASYYPTNTGSIIPLNPSAFKIGSRNLFDKNYAWTTSNGYIINDAGVSTYDGASEYLVESIPVKPNRTYYAIAGRMINGLQRVYFYNSSNGFISRTANQEGSFSFTTPSNCTSIKLQYRIETKNMSAWCINLSDALDGTYTPFVNTSTTIDTSFTSDYKYVNENCYDYVENVIENGVVKGKKHVVVGGGSIGTGWSYNSTRQAWDKTISGIKTDSDLLTTNYLFVGIVRSSAQIQAMAVGTCAINGTTIFIKNGSDSIEPSGDMYYELATESVTDVDPIPNFPVEDGTTVQAVTPQTDLVNAIDVPSTIAYMTKIAS